MSSGVYSITSPIRSSSATATEHARSNPSAILIGWIPRSRRAVADSSRAPARTTTPVVPSPISSSCDFDSSTRSFATWCSTCIWPMMVAPSLVTVMSPSGEIMILSRPRGPRLVLTMLLTVRAARMCDLSASIPCSRVFLPWSRMTIWVV